MTSPSRDSLVLAIPRKDGLLVTVDGAAYFKSMRPIQMVWLAQSLLKAAGESMEKDDGLVRQGQKESQRDRQTKEN